MSTLGPPDVWKAPYRDLHSQGFVSVATAMGIVILSLNIYNTGPCVIVQTVTEAPVEISSSLHEPWVFHCSRLQRLEHGCGMIHEVQLPSHSRHPSSARFVKEASEWGC